MANAGYMWSTQHVPRQYKTSDSSEEPGDYAKGTGTFGANLRRYRSAGLMLPALSYMRPLWGAANDLSLSEARRYSEVITTPSHTLFIYWSWYARLHAGCIYDINLL